MSKICVKCNRTININRLPFHYINTHSIHVEPSVHEKIYMNQNYIKYNVGKYYFDDTYDIIPYSDDINNAINTALFENKKSIEITYKTDDMIEYHHINLMDLSILMDRDPTCFEKLFNCCDDMKKIKQYTLAYDMNERTNMKTKKDLMKFVNDITEFPLRSEYIKELTIRLG